SPDLGDIHLRNLVARVGNALGEHAVVGEKQQTGRVDVEAPDGKDARLRIDEAENGLTSFPVVRRRHHTDRLVERDVHQVDAGRDRHPVDLDAVRRLDARAELGHGAVHANAARADELLGRAPRSVAGAREHLLEALAVQDSSISSDAASPGSGAECAASARSMSAAISGDGANDASGGRSAREPSPIFSRNSGDVPKAGARPGPGSRPTSITSPRSCSVASTESTLTPRTREISARVTGCLYATMASVSSAGFERRPTRERFAKCPTAPACSLRV